MWPHLFPKRRWTRAWRPPRKSTGEYRKQYPELAEDLSQMQHRMLPLGGGRDLPEFQADPRRLVTRESNAKVLNAAAKNIPWLIGGAADLAPSTKDRPYIRGRTRLLGGELCGANFHFGIREHSMGAPLKHLLKKFGFNTENVVATAKSQMEQHRSRG